MISISPVSPSVSRSVWTLKVNPLTGTFKVRWFKGALQEYTYKTRRRDILPLMLAGDRSLGTVGKLSHWCSPPSSLRVIL